MNVKRCAFVLQALAVRSTPNANDLSVKAINNNNNNYYERGSGVH